MKSLNAIKAISQQPGSSSRKTMALNFQKQMEGNLGPGKIMAGVSDIFYFPQSYAERYVFAMEIFHQYGVHMGIGPAAVLGGIASGLAVNSIAGEYVWGDVNSILIPLLFQIYNIYC